MRVVFKAEAQNTLKLYLEALQQQANNDVTELIKNYKKQIESLEGNFLSLVIKAFGFEVIENFVANGKKFFKSLPKIITYEGYLDLIESIFLSREIKINYVKTGEIEITVFNKNYELLKTYTDNKDKKYLDSIEKKYKGFKGQDFMGLEKFFKKFLQPFLPAGIKLSKVYLINLNNKQY